MPHASKVLDGLVQKKMSWFDLVRARQAVILEHIEDIGQMKLEDTLHSLMPGGTVQSRLGDHLRDVTWDSTVNPRMRGVFIFDRASYGYNMGTGLVSLQIYGFARNGVWVLAEVSFKLRDGLEVNKAAVLSRPSLEELDEKHYVRVQTIMGDLSLVVKNHMDRRLKLYEKARDLAFVMSVEDQLLHDRFGFLLP